MAAPHATTKTQVPRALLRELRRLVGKANVLTSPADLALYSYDAATEQHNPEVVVFPASTEEVAQVVQAANRFGVPFVPRGAGTCLSGGPVPIRGGIVIALSRLNRLLGIDAASYCAVLQPGLTNLALQDALAAQGWIFHPDPASQKVSTLGGNVAENSGGPHCLKYGVTTNHILGARVVLPDGEVANFGGAALDAPGYDLTGLITGSEGTLGVVTEITVRIYPRPQAVRTLLVIFDSMDAAGQAVSAVIAAGIIPASLEMMDRPMMAAVQASMNAGYPDDAEAVLIIEVDGLREALEQEARRSEEICRELGAREVRVATSEREREQLWAGRRGAGGAIARIAPANLVNDSTVPRAKLPYVLRQTYEIAERYGLRVANNFHAGDGNLHPAVLFDDRDPAQRAAAKRASLDIMRACLDAGGTLSGEHGIGLEKRAAMLMLYSPAELAAHAAIKHAFDPRGLCNPGKIFPDTLPPLPERPASVSPQSAATATPLALAVDGKRPTGFLAPESESEIAALLAGAADERATVIPLGSGTKLDLGMPPQRFDYALSLARLGGIIEHDAENTTATVRAGARLADVRAELAERGQWLPLDPPHQDATIGGIIAANSYGPRRMRAGACRDLVLGMRIALPSGHVISIGGKTVKNVSGYDLVKLFIGSLGTLGVITAATFRLLPLPQRDAWTAWAFADLEATMRCAHQLAASQLELVADEVLSGDLVSRPGAWMLACRAQGMESAVERQLSAVADICTEAGGTSVDDPANDWQRAATDAIWRWRPAATICRLAAPPAELTAIVETARRLLGGGNCVVNASPAIGVARVALAAERPADVVTALRRECAARGGRLVIERGPVELKLAAGVWGSPGAEPVAPRVMRALKAEFDPAGILSPGRFVGGI